MPTTKITDQLPFAQVKLSTFETDDSNVAAEQMFALYGMGARLEHFGEAAEFSTRVEAASFGGVTLAKHESANWSYTREGRKNISLTLVLDGDLNYRSGARVHDHDPSTGMSVGRPFETTRAEVKRNVALNLAIPTQGILERAERITGESYGDSLFSSIVDRVDANDPIAKALSRGMKTAMVEISGLGLLGMGALAAAGHEDILLNLAVACLFPAVANHLAIAPPPCGSAVIRRARDFIHAHATRPMEFSRLAADLGVSMRALQENFHRYFGCSPRAYLLACRLDLARQSLLMPKGATSVTRIGFDCGFGDLSRFSAKYREKFGESPSETLRAARR